ncbi:hypothetical protein CF160_14010 [Enterococcus pseudoavium]|nr:hypothetical protein CF160_02550 [Enterococcus pseudoavium]REC33474.1 hypothetical protein CF160_14010 [Enterococcus pseudoavium]
MVFTQLFLILRIFFLLVIAFSLYLRLRLETKYRDLSLISLLLLFILGVQYSDYNQNTLDLIYIAYFPLTYYKNFLR